MKKIYILMIFMMLSSLSCGKDNVKPSADSLLATEAVNSINAIKDAYKGKQKSTLQNRIDAGLADRILEDLTFSKAELFFNPRLVRISDSLVTINLNWRGSWWTALDERINNRGVVNLVLDKGSMKLLKIDGNNPFLTPSFGNANK